jgi:hypothetical protein
MLKTSINRRNRPKTGQKPPDEPATNRTGPATIRKVAVCQDRRGVRQFGVDERGKGRLVVAARRIDNSPAFQCRVQSANDPSPAGTTGVFKMKSLAIAEMK